MIRIKNKDVIKVFFLLRDIPLGLKESRLRSKFCKILAQHNDGEYIHHRQQIVDEFSFIDENGQQIVPAELVPKYNEEIKILENEELLIECNEMNKTIILCIKNILFSEHLFVNSDNCSVLSGETALIHDTMCDIFEEAVEKYYQE